MDYMIIAGPEYHRAMTVALIEFVQMNDIKFRRAGKTEAMAIQLTAIREDQYEIELREKQIVKQTWNRNRQRNLRHYPGRRWIDLKTMHK